MIEQHVRGLDVAMHDTFGVRVAQRVGEQADRRQNLLESFAGDDADLGAVDKLKAVERKALVLMEFEDPNDMGMH